MKTQDEEAERAEVVARWLHLCRDVLPGMSPVHRWPITADHCFMRVFLDGAMGRRWDTAVKRPAVRHMALADLKRAIALAEAVTAAPQRLPGMNAASLAWRRR